ncbi:hypothetical protein FRX31_029030, partial [Thalictrum thalictroides]
MIVTSRVQLNSKKRSFRFFNFWVQEAGYHEVVKRAWTMGAAGNPMYRFMCKRRFTKHELITWYKNSIGNVNNKLEEAKEEVEE